MLPGSIPTKISDALRAVVADEWSSARVEVIAYRDAALDAQNWQCAYCLREILRNELGHRELDHVLPKSQKPKDGFDAARSISNNFEDRRHTAGYGLFRYEPKNLVIACKRCNSFKGSHDCLADRSMTLKSYPIRGQDFEWIHPYYDDHSEHISLVNGALFKVVNASKKGQAVIRACGLDRTEELTRRLIDKHVARAIDVGLAMLNIVMIERIFDLEKVSCSIHEKFNVGPVELIEDLFVDLQAGLQTGSMAVRNCLDDLMRKLMPDGQ
ncbi:HNH endonuclease [Variovorax sp. R-27]|uniref:HNH endonuclease n=1 Tax=Variovorax sp. R-27 TaxID=3404058 RepID=UPI003CE86502